MLKDALEDRRLWTRLNARPLFVGLDFDGTLAPIVPQPEDARLAPGMQEALARLAARHTVAVISGRDLADLRRRIGLDGLVYAGSHGFEMALPPGSPVPPSPGLPFASALDEAERILAEELARIEGARLDRKRFTVAAHYRQAGPGGEAAVRRAVEAARQPGLTAMQGKMVYELRPDVDWHKGAAFDWLRRALAPRALPIFIGDDMTDEDAFRALPRGGVGVLVAEQERATAARWRVPDVEAVRRLLERLAA